MLQWHVVHGLAYVIILMTRMILLRFVLEPERKNSKQYYMDRPRIAGDYHGQAPIIWCAYALLNK